MQDAYPGVLDGHEGHTPKSRCPLLSVVIVLFPNCAVMEYVTNYNQLTYAGRRCEHRQFVRYAPVSVPPALSFSSLNLSLNLLHSSSNFSSSLKS